MIVEVFGMGCEVGSVDLHTIYMPTMNHPYMIVLLSHEPLPQFAVWEAPSRYIHAMVDTTQPLPRIRYMYYVELSDSICRCLLAFLKVEIIIYFPLSLSLGRFKKIMLKFTH